MINTTQFTDWPNKGSFGLARFNKSSPSLVLLRAYLIATFGGANLGIYGVRPIRGGTTLSTHAFGAALDWSYRGITGGRTRALEVMQWLIDHSNELGVQAVHDYVGCRIWHSTRALDAAGGWKAQNASATTGMGQTWGDWLHIETFEAAWANIAPIAGRLTTAELTPEQPIDPGNLSRTVPTLTVGSDGPLVAAVQTILRERASQDVGASDGKFGARTLAGWRNVAAFTGLPADDRIDEAHDWDVLAWIDQGWSRLYTAGFPAP